MVPIVKNSVGKKIKNTSKLKRGMSIEYIFVPDTYLKLIQFQKRLTRRKCNGFLFTYFY